MIDPVSPADLAEPNSEPLSIWVIEDNRDFRQTVVEVVNNVKGLRCGGEFQSCEEALATLTTADAPEIILLDIGLPGMSGIEGIGRLKAISPTTGIVILTVYDDDDKIFRAICAGASGYLLKSSPPEQIVQGIIEVTEGGAPMNAQIAKKVMNLLAGKHSPAGEYGLTKREKEILGELVGGTSKKDIARKLFLSIHTVDTHIKNIYSKLQVHTSASLVAKAYTERLI